MSSQSKSSMSSEDSARIFAVLSRIDVALNDVRTTCADLKAGAAVTSLKLDRAIATLEGHSGRIKALETRYEHVERYLHEVKPCPELKIMGIPSALACTGDSDLRHLCASILELFGTGHTITDVQEIRWLNPTSGRRTGSKPNQPLAARTMVVRYKQTDTRDYVLRAKRKFGDVLASAVLPGASGSLQVFEMHSKYVLDLLKKVKEVAKERGYAYVWARGGIVFAKKCDGSNVIELLIEPDLERL